jgi:hypothetical protein
VNSFDAGAGGWDQGPGNLPQNYPGPHAMPPHLASGYGGVPPHMGVLGTDHPGLMSYRESDLDPVFGALPGQGSMASMPPPYMSMEAHRGGSQYGMQMHGRSEYMTQPHSGGRGMPPGNLLGGPPGNLGPYPYGMSGPMSQQLGGQMLGSSPLPVGPQSALDLPDPRRYPRGRMLDDGFDGRMPPHMMDPYMQDPYMPMPGGMPPGASKAYMDRMAGMVDGPPPLYAGGPAPYAEY